MKTIEMWALILSSLTGFFGLWLTIRTEGNKSRDEFRRAIADLDKRVAVIDAHTTGNSARFQSIDEELRHIKTAVAGAANKASITETEVTSLTTRIDKIERQIEVLQKR
ncbi:hypothetical protein ACH42_06290 [Endozoicomonas sp. (ex Bugula neritina AB1)]|nr:hypothetical protein ACH42_06290 [Endozoicomonas sp. (ex Bugula neritina AB1)]